jgi:hypothetical protein
MSSRTLESEFRIGKKPLEILRFILRSACGGLIGVLIYSGAFGPTDWTAFFITLIAMLLISVAFIEPFSRTLRARVGAEGSTPEPEEVSPASIQSIEVALIAILVIAIHELVSEGVRSTWNTSSVSVPIFCAIPFLTIAGVSGFWIIGAHRQPRNAAIFGSVGGTITLVALFYAALFSTTFHPLLKTSLLPHLFIASHAVVIGGIGLAGGLVIDKDPRSEYLRELCVRILLSTFVAAILLFLLFSLYRELFSRSFFISYMLIGLGWSLGLLVCPYETVIASRSEIAQSRSPAPTHKIGQA